MNNKTVVNDNISVPLDIYQTWYTKDLPPGMMNSVIKLRKDNPEFKYHLFDDDDCKKFIKEEFGLKVYDAFENLIPGAYKADLWRYCILFKKGGIYIDIKFHTNNFNLKQLTDNDYFVKDRDAHWEKNKIGIYNGFMIAKPKNQIFLKCISEIIENVYNGNMGLNALYPTGPGLLGKYFKNTDVFPLQFSNDAYHIQYNGKNILSMYKTYREEQTQFQQAPHYSFLWAKKLIYKNAFDKIKIDRQLLFDIILIKNVKTLIPTKIFQVYLEPTITPKVEKKSKHIQQIVPYFGYFLFSLYDCGEFIRKNFDFKIYSAFTKLKHVKNKLDLWKYCVLYKNGGIYIDLNYNLTNDFNISLYLFKNFYLKDSNINFIVPDIIISEKGNKKLLNCIEKIVSNVKENNYGSDWSEVSNSSLITSQFTKKELDIMELVLKDNKIYHDNILIVDSIDEDYYKLKESNIYSWEMNKIY
jgi:mannosyltransferase OCH1-like enzyme